MLLQDVQGRICWSKLWPRLQHRQLLPRPMIQQLSHKREKLILPAHLNFEVGTVEVVPHRVRNPLRFGY